MTTYIVKIKLHNGETKLFGDFKEKGRAEDYTRLLQIKMSELIKKCTVLPKVEFN